mmetsp:Transcript_46340/g.114922  ORF Transcript_46340/g.114922 Transcript_46340/m.114922 type:complete len:112 (-) Transcript_46340:195-530(-)
MALSTVALQGLLSGSIQAFHTEFISLKSRSISFTARRTVSFVNLTTAHHTGPTFECLNLWPLTPDSAMKEVALVGPRKRKPLVNLPQHLFGLEGDRVSSSSSCHTAEIDSL